MIKGASVERSVGIVIGLSRAVIDQQANNVFRKITVAEVIVAAVADAAVITLHHADIRPPMIFRIIGNVDACSALAVKRP